MQKEFTVEHLSNVHAGTKLHISSFLGSCKDILVLEIVTYIDYATFEM